jgi:hypothetical protein
MMKSSVGAGLAAVVVTVPPVMRKVTAPITVRRIVPR